MPNAVCDLEKRNAKCDLRNAICKCTKCEMRNAICANRNDLPITICKKRSAICELKRKIAHYVNAKSHTAKAKRESPSRPPYLRRNS